jgi:hypothetical protein
MSWQPSPISGFFAIRGHKSTLEKFADQILPFLLKMSTFRDFFFYFTLLFAHTLILFASRSCVTCSRILHTHTHTHHTTEKFRNTPARGVSSVWKTQFFFLFSATIRSFNTSILHPLRLPFSQQSSSTSFLQSQSEIRFSVVSITKSLTHSSDLQNIPKIATICGPICYTYSRRSQLSYFFTSTERKHSAKLPHTHSCTIPEIESFLDFCTSGKSKLNEPIFISDPTRYCCLAK